MKLGPLAISGIYVIPHQMHAKEEKLSRQVTILTETQNIHRHKHSYITASVARVVANWLPCISVYTVMDADSGYLLPWQTDTGVDCSWFICSELKRHNRENNYTWAWVFIWNGESELTHTYAMIMIMHGIHKRMAEKIYIISCHWFMICLFSNFHVNVNYCKDL